MEDFTNSRAARRPGLTLATLCLAVLVAQIDTAAVNLANRAIGDDLKVGVGAMQWILDSYNLVYALLLLTGGLLADLYGRRRLFMAGVAIFAIASLLCALAPSASALIASRAVTGLGAAFLVPASLAIIRVVWPDSIARNRALGIWAACNGLAMAIGPTLGGVLVGHFGWRSIFLVVIPFCVITLALSVPSIPESSDPQGRHFDGAAQVFGAIALGGLAFAAIQYRLAPHTALISCLIAVLALVAFIRIEAGKGAAVLVPLDMFRSRVFRGAAMATTGMTFGMYGTLFLLPLTWQSANTFDALGAGIALMPMALVFVVVSPLSGMVTQRYGARVSIASGLAIIGAGLFLIGPSELRHSIVPAEFGLAMTGLGMGLATGPLMGAAVGAMPAARSGTASALINVARMIGATAGVALLGTAYAMAKDLGHGLNTAMLIGAAVEVICAMVAWRTLEEKNHAGPTARMISAATPRR